MCEEVLTEGTDGVAEVLMRKSIQSRNYDGLMKNALLGLERMESKINVLEYANREPIAIIGIGCRFPGGADSPEAFWQRLRDGVDAIVEVPSDRLDIEAYYDPNPDAPGKMYSRCGGFLDRVDTFDPEFLASRHGRQLVWIRSNACCWRSVGRL